MPCSTASIPTRAATKRAHAPLHLCGLGRIPDGREPMTIVGKSFPDLHITGPRVHVDKSFDNASPLPGCVRVTPALHIQAFTSLASTQSALTVLGPLASDWPTSPRESHAPSSLACVIAPSSQSTTWARAGASASWLLPHKQSSLSSNFLFLPHPRTSQHAHAG